MTTQDMGMTQITNVANPIGQQDVMTLNAAMATAAGLPRVWINGTQATGVTLVGFSTAVTSGSLVLYLTSDGTITGTAMFPNNVFPATFVATVNDTTINPLFSWVLSNSNKTLTVSCKQLTVVLGVLGFTTNLANGTIVNLSIAGN